MIFIIYNKIKYYGYNKNFDILRYNTYNSYIYTINTKHEPNVLFSLN